MNSESISLHSVMVSILGRWRFILLFTLIVSIIGTGILTFMAYNNSDEVSDSSQDQLNETQLLVDTLSDEVDAIHINIDNTENFLEKNPIMKEDASRRQMTRMQLVIGVQLSHNTQLPDNQLDEAINRIRDNLMKSYEIAADNTAIHEKIKENTELAEDIAYMSSMIEVSAEAPDVLFIDVYVEPGLARKALDVIYAELKNTESSYNKSIATHTLTLVSITDHIVNSTQLAENQKEMRKELNTQRMLLLTKEKELRGAQEQLKQLESTETKPFALSSLIRSICVCVFAGLLLSVFWVLLRDTLTHRVFSENRLTVRYSLHLLGVMPSSRGKYNTWFDKTVRKMDGSLDDYANNQICADAIHVQLGKISQDCGYKTLFVTGSINPSFHTNVLNLLYEGQPNLRPFTDLFYSDSTIKALISCDAVVLVESLSESRTPAVEQVIEHIKAMGKDIAGIIFV